MRRLYLHIYFAVVGMVVVTLFLAGIAGRMLRQDFGHVPRLVQDTAQLVARDLPPPGTSPEVVERVLRRSAHRHGMFATLWDRSGRPVAQVGPPLPGPHPGEHQPRWLPGRFHRGVLVRLDDGRWLSAAMRGPGPRRLQHFLLVLLFVAVVMAIGSYPIARRITRRLEALQKGVERWGAGALQTQVAVEGRDEVADVARSFNQAAARVAVLLEQQKRVLASASHELRAPLTRLRMSLELLDEGPEAGATDPTRRQVIDGATRDIEELDALIGDVLLAARLEATEPAAGTGPAGEPVNITEVLRETAGRLGVKAAGEAALVNGDRRMLQRMLRNLLDNAQRYGGDHNEAWVEQDAERVRVVVADRGPGVPEAERERIFEPFYRPAGHREGADGGVGLGLALVRHIATFHGGTSRCVARDGGGSRFEVDLPRAV